MLPLPMVLETPGHVRLGESSGRHSGAICQPRSCRLQIRFKGLDRDFKGGPRILAPQFASVEHNRIEPLRIFALVYGDRVGEDVAAAHGFDHADAVARVARQARMRRRMNVLGAHSITRLEPRRRLRRPRVRAARDNIGHVARGQFAFERFARAQRVAGREFVRPDKAEFGKELFHAQFPLSVIGTGEIDSRRQALAGKPGLVDDPHAGVAHRAIERVKASFPIIVKDGLVLLRLDFAEAVHAAHVVDTIHHATSLAALARPLPIMLSRVTRPANFSSLQPSVPAGRIGNTMKRVSAVESHTRIAVPAGSLTPKSANTPRGSFTARERYGADLYQTGGRPRTSQG